MQQTANALSGFVFAQPSMCSSFKVLMKVSYNCRWIGAILARITYSSFSGKADRSTVCPRLKVKHRKICTRACHEFLIHWSAKKLSLQFQFPGQMFGRVLYYNL